MFSETNWLAVFVTALTSMIVGFIWYNPKVFGTAWMKATGLTMDDSKKSNMGLIFSLSYVCSVVVCAFLSTWVHPDDHLSPFMHGAFHGMMLSVFIAVPFVIQNALYETRGWKYALINASYTVVTTSIEGGILFSWPS
ncbi:MAG: DUF1761 domain-containing protein [Flavobacteriales bacterium]|nr:DUF1761 domain-containing protein [Flavobacteriales bacterium]